MRRVNVLPAPDVVVSARAAVGEGPVFDHRTGRLCWVDITEGVLYQDDLGTGDRDTATVATMLGAVAPRAGAEGFAVAVSDGLGFWQSGPGRLIVADPVLPEPHRRMNDAKCDSAGRLHEAVRYAAESGDWPFASEIVVEEFAVGQLMESRGHQPLAGAFERMPRDTAWGQPGPLLALAEAALRLRPDKLVSALACMVAAQRRLAQGQATAALEMIRGGAPGLVASAARLARAQAGACGVAPITSCSSPT